MSEPGAASVPHEARRFGRYRLRYQLGAGGMATVYLGQMRGAGGFERPVAIKRIHPHLSARREFVEMFLDEARIAARITHPNVCAVYDFGEHAGAYYIAMEYLSGLSLREVLARSDRESLATPRWRALAAYVVHEAAEGLHAAHETRDDSGAQLEVVHRDVTPHNIVLTFDGGVKIVDFGVAHARGRIRGTVTGGLKGKLAYMAPEYASEGRVTRGADVWGLGVVLWEMLTGKRLFKKSNEMNTLLAVRSMPVPAPSSVAPGVPPELDRIVLRALSRDREARYPSARELARDLAAFVRSQEAGVSRVELSEWLQERFGEDRETEEHRLREALVGSEADDPWDRTSATSSASAEDGATTTVPDPSVGEPRPRRRPRIGAIALGVGLLFAGGGGALLALDEGDAERRTETPQSPSAASPAVGDLHAIRTPAPDEGARAMEVEPPTEASSEPVVEPSGSVEPGTSEGPAAEPAATERRSRARSRAARREAATRRSEPGRVSIATVGGYASVYLGTRSLGETPLAEVTLPAGQHRLRLVPSGGRPPRWVTVRIRSGETRRVTVNLD